MGQKANVYLCVFFSVHVGEQKRKHNPPSSRNMCGCVAGVAVAGQRVTTYSTAFGCPTTTTCAKKKKCGEWIVLPGFGMVDQTWLEVLCGLLLDGTCD